MVERSRVDPGSSWCPSFEEERNGGSVPIQLEALAKERKSISTMASEKYRWGRSGIVELGEVPELQAAKRGRETGSGVRTEEINSKTFIYLRRLPASLSYLTMSINWRKAVPLPMLFTHHHHHDVGHGS